MIECIFKEYLSQPVRCSRLTSHPEQRGTRTLNGDTSSTAVRMWPSARWGFVVVCCCCFPSSDVTMVQMVRVGLCISTGACHGLGHASLTPSHVTHVSQCRQLYLDQRLVAVTQTGEVKVRDENINGIFCNNFSITVGWDVQFSIMLLLSYNEFNPLTFNQLNIKYAQASWQLYQLYL